MSDFSSVTRWAVLREAVREANTLGVKLRDIGDRVETEGDLPSDLRARLEPEMVRDYLGISSTDAAEIAFLANRLKVETVLVEDDDGFFAAIEALTGCNPIAIDIETCPPDHRPKPIRINRDGAVSATQPKREIPGGTCPHRSLIQLVQLYGGPRNGKDRAYLFRGAVLQRLIHSVWLTRQHLVAHSAGFELAFLQHHANFKPVHPVECTFQASGLIYGPGRSLADTSYHALGLEPPKGLATSCWNAPKLSRGQVAYAASDPVLTLLCWTDLEDRLREADQLEVYRLQRDAIPVAAAMQVRGLGFDADEHRRQTDIWSRELAKARHEYHALTGEAPPTTSVEIRSWLTNVAGSRLAHWPRTPTTGELSTKRKHLKRLILSGEETVKPVLRMLTMDKLLRSFGPSLREHVAPRTGRIHGSYLVARAKSGRIISSNPNLQQLPATKAPDFKGCIVPAPGYLLVGGDFSQIELRVAAWIYGDPVLTELLAAGHDLHQAAAAAMLGIPLDEVTPDQRKRAKAVNFGSLYGIGARSLAENAYADYDIDMSVPEAREALDRFFDTFSTLRDGLKEHARLCQQRGYVEAGPGRIVLAEWQVETNGHLTDQQCNNLPIQGTAADATLRALPRVDRRLAGFHGGIIVSAHDEIVAEVAEDEAEAAKAIIEEEMLAAFEETLPGAPTTNVVKAVIGKSWKELK